MRFDAINSGPALASGELDAYCDEHGLVLPVSLRRQLLDQNGGAPRADVSVALPDGDETELLSVFGLMMRNVSSELAWVVETYSGRVPDGLVPFADDAGGNLFLVDAHGLVWFWDHEQEGSREAVRPLRESLDRVLDALAG
jgi:hypothetical protein